MLVARAPSPPLSSSVRWLWHATDWHPPHARELHMPDGSANIIISLRDPAGHHHGAARGTPAIIVGPQSRASFIDTSQPQTVLGVHFRPGAAATFVDGPISELCNQSAPLADVGGPLSASLRDRLLELRTADARLDLVERWLTDRVLRRPPPEAAILWAVQVLQRRPQVRIGDVTSRVGRSARWFINRFASDVGLTPKVFSRVQRFQQAVQCLHEERSTDLADVASAIGYFDQAHFTHDFRAIAGMTPGEYLARRTEYVNHVRA